MLIDLEGSRGSKHSSIRVETIIVKRKARKDHEALSVQYDHTILVWRLSYQQAGRCIVRLFDRGISATFMPASTDDNVFQIVRVEP
jgi:hypothetical protein